MKDLVVEKRLNQIKNWQNERIVKYFLLTDNHNRYKIMISEQTNNGNTELEINKLFNDKQVALDLIEFLYENSVSLEQSNEIVEDLLRKRGG